MTKRESILAAIKTKLDAIPGIPTYRSRVVAFTKNKVPALVLEPVSDSADSSVIPMIDWSLQFRVVVIVRGDIPDQIADPFIEAVHAKLYEDVTLGELCLDIQPLSVNYLFEDADETVGLVFLNYRARYRTSESNLS